MATPKALPPLGQVYGRAWNSCMALWPLLAVQLVFSILQFGALVFCIILLFGSLIAKYAGLLAENPQAIDPTQMADDWLQKVSDPSWMWIFTGLVFLYLTWWLLLSTVMDGGIFRTFWRRRLEEGSFSLSYFFQEGLRLFVPMMWLQFFLSIYGLALLAVLVLAVLVFLAVLVLFHSGFVSTALAFVFLGLPFLVLWIAACSMFAVYTFAAKARLALGDSPRGAMARAYQDCKDNRFRILKAGLLACVLYLLATFAFSVVFGVLSLIPLIGLLFTLARGILNTFLALLIQTGLPALMVDLTAERDGLG